MTTAQAFYAEHGRISDPGAQAHLFDNLPTALEELVRVVQGVTIHIFWTEAYGFKVPPERRGELQLRWMEPRLARTVELDPRPLSQPRPVDKKLVGNCRDFSLLLTALLRHQGVPARARCGFGAYFEPNHYIDHWVVEYWNTDQQRWILVDAQLDAVQCDALKIGFNPLDVPRDQFLVGGRAWQLVRAGQADPDQFGIFDLHGLGFIRGDLVRDVASLNKMELLPWDCWGVIVKDEIDNADDLALLDTLAALTASAVPEWETVCARYQSDSRLHMTGSLVSYVDGNAVQVTVA